MAASNKMKRPVGLSPLGGGGAPPAARAQAKACGLDARAPRRSLFLHLLNLALEQGEVFADFLGYVFSVKAHCRVIADDIAPAFALDDLTARFVDALDAENFLGGNTTQEHHQLGIDQLDLLEEIVRRAGVY